MHGPASAGSVCCRAGSPLWALLESAVNGAISSFASLICHVSGGILTWSLGLQDTQEFLRCLMDQLHEELKEPVVAETRDLDTSDQEDKREGDRSPSEDEFLSCDSSSDRGEGEGQSRTSGSMGSSSLAETELLIQDEAGRGISEKERMKDRKFSCGHRRSNSEQVDEDADVDTTMMQVDGRASPEMLPAPCPASPCRTPGIPLFQSGYFQEDVLPSSTGTVV